MFLPLLILQARERLPLSHVFPSLLYGHGLQLDQAFKRNKRDKNTACKLFPFFQRGRPSQVCAYIHSSRSPGLCSLVLLQISDLRHGSFRLVSYTLLRNWANTWRNIIWDPSGCLSQETASLRKYPSFSG